MDINKIRAIKNYSSLQEKDTPTEKGDFWIFLNRDIRFGKSGLPDKTKEDFYLELWTLLSAGVDIQTSLELIKDEQKKKNRKLVLDDIVKEVVAGTTLSGAMKKSKSFSNYEYHSIQIGEESGKLLQVLKELATFFEKKIKQRRQIIGAITYPVVVLLVAFGAVSFMISYVVPMFSETFKRFGSDLPSITQSVIDFSGFIKRSAGFFFLIVTGLIVFAISQRRKNWFRKFSTALLLKIPVIGDIIKKIYLARFANTMALLTGARIPMLQAIQLTQRMISFYPIENSLHYVEERITNGDHLYKSLSEHSIYPQKMISIIKVAEEVNQMELFFKRFADQYSNEVEHQTTVLSKLLEPLIIVVLGLIVGVILIAMYLPLFKLGQTF